MTLTDHEGGVVAQSQQPEAQSMEDVHKPSHSGILAKRHQPNSFLVQDPLVVHKTNTLQLHKHGGSFNTVCVCVCV